MVEKYIAITGLGWGKGDTPEEAIAVYRRTQIRSFPVLKKEPELLDESWGFVWEPPADISGWSMDQRLWWQFADRDPEQATDDQKVAEVGNVPEVARLKEGV